MLSSQRTAWFKGHLRKVGTAAGNKQERQTLGGPQEEISNSAQIKY